MGGGNIDMGWERVVATAAGGTADQLDVDCSAGKQVMGGGCTAGATTVYVVQTYPLDTNTWRCTFSSTAAAKNAYALCANIR